MNTIGERLKYLRKINKLTQKDVATATGVQRGNISHYEKNDFAPSKVAINSLANFFNTTPEWILEGKGENPSPKLLKDDSNKLETKTIGERIKELRIEKKISQTELAKSINVSSGNVDDWESDRAKPSADAIVELMNYFNISADYLLTGEKMNSSLIKDETETTYTSDSELKEILRKFITEENSLKNIDLTERERNLILAFRTFDNFDKEMVENTVNVIFRRLEKISQQTSYAYNPGNEDENAAAIDYEEHSIKKHA